MGLVADHLQKLQRWITSLQSNRLFSIRNVNLFFTFRQACDRNALDAETIQRGERGIELTTAAIDENQIGQRLLLPQQSSIPPIDRLGHRAKVIRADHGLDVEDAVLLLVELPAVENDHAGDRITSLNVRDVERLDALDLAAVTE